MYFALPLKNKQAELHTGPILITEKGRSLRFEKWGRKLKTSKYFKNRVKDGQCG